MTEDAKFLEQRLLSELGNINRHISELESERQTLKRLILRVRRNGVGSTTVARRDSVVRVLVQEAILERLGQGGERGVSSNNLWLAALSANPSLKLSTFRSHLHRLKMSETISSPKYGVWKLHSSSPSG